MATATPNSDAVYKIVYAWGLAFAPHLIKIVTLSSAGHKWDNRLGRGNMTKDSSEYKCSPAALARARRSDAAHQNGMESFPLFAISVLAAVKAGLDSGTMGTYTNAYLALRFVYNVLYIVGGSDAVALTRTMAWMASVGTSITLLVKSARLLALKGL